MNKRSHPVITDDENPAWTAADFARSRPLSNLSSPLQAKLRGRPKADETRVAISLRLPPTVLDAWKATGAGWQTRMVATLTAKAPRL